MINKLGILFIIKKSKVNRKGYVPINCRITVNGKKAEISTGQKIKIEHWDRVKTRVRKNKPNARFINERLDAIQNEIHRQFNIMDSKNQIISAAALADQISGRNVVQKTLLEVFRYHNEIFYKKIGVDYTYSTYKRYLVTYGKVERFIQNKYSKKDIFLEDVNRTFITDFDLFLKEDEGNQLNTATKHVKNLRKIIKLALDNEWMTKDPYANLKFKTKETNREALTKEELERIKNKEIDIERLSKARDLFLFTCYTGLSFSDLKDLRTTDLSTDENGNRWIIIYRKKTNTRSPILLIDDACAIIDKYANTIEQEITGKLLPVNSNQRMNGYLKEIAAICNIKKNLTMHVGRHTFATTITLANGVPIETVSRMLGHKSLKTTGIYAKVVDNKIASEMSQVNRKLSGKASQSFADV